MSDYRIKLTGGRIEKENVNYYEDNTGCLVTGTFVDPNSLLNDWKIRIEFNFTNLYWSSAVMENNGNEFQLDSEYQVYSNGDVSWRFDCPFQLGFWASITLMKVQSA